MEDLHLLNQSIMLSFLFWQNYITILLLVQLLLNYIGTQKSLPWARKKRIYLPTVLSFFLPGDLTVQWKAFESDKVWSLYQLYFLWVKWFWASDVSVFHTFPRAERPTSIQKHIERLHWISQISAGSLRPWEQLPPFIPKWHHLKHVRKHCLEEASKIWNLWGIPWWANG